MATVPTQSNKGFYDRISHAYDTICDAGEHKAREKGEALLNIQPGEQVLEIGFGTGNSLGHFAEKVGSAGKVHGTDVSAGMLDVATKKLTEQGLMDQVELAVGDARQLSWADNSMDAVFSSFTLELFPIDEIPAVLAEVKRVLKPGGRMGVVSMATVLEGDAASMLEKTYVWMHEHFPHIVDCQPIDLEGLLTSNGFVVDTCEEIKIWTMPVRSIVAKIA